MDFLWKFSSYFIIPENFKKILVYLPLMMLSHPQNEWDYLDSWVQLPNWYFKPHFHDTFCRIHCRLVLRICNANWYLNQDVYLINAVLSKMLFCQTVFNQMVILSKRSSVKQHSVKVVLWKRFYQMGSIKQPFFERVFEEKGSGKRDSDKRVSI